MLFRMNKMQGYTHADSCCRNRMCLSTLWASYQFCKDNLFRYQKMRAEEISPKDFNYGIVKNSPLGQLRNATSFMIGKNISIDKDGIWHIKSDFNTFNLGATLHARDMLDANRLIWC